MKMKASQLFKIGDFRTVEVDIPEPHGKDKPNDKISIIR